MSNSVEFLYTAKTGLVTMTAGESALDGTGNIYTIITGGASGTLVKTLIVKAQTDVSDGMIRFFVKKSSGKNLIREVRVMPITKSARDFSYNVTIPLNYYLESGDILYGTTENSETFNIIAEALDVSYGATAAYLDSTLKYVWNSGSDKVDTANNHLDGTGAVQIFAAGSSGTYSGCAVKSITVKARQAVTPGMVRLYVGPGGMTPPFLFTEVVIPAVAQSATLRTFERDVIVSGAFSLQADYFIYATTENSEAFSIVVEAADWKYV